jgi:hypothetical protein
MQTYDRDLNDVFAVQHDIACAFRPGWPEPGADGRDYPFTLRPSAGISRQPRPRGWRRQ